MAKITFKFNGAWAEVTEVKADQPFEAPFRPDHPHANKRGNMDGVSVNFNGYVVRMTHQEARDLREALSAF